MALIHLLGVLERFDRRLRMMEAERDYFKRRGAI
jgi:hypothetical protein